MRKKNLSNATSSTVEGYGILTLSANKLDGFWYYHLYIFNHDDSKNIIVLLTWVMVVCAKVGMGERPEFIDYQASIGGIVQT